MKTLTEVIDNKRYESDDKQTVMVRCTLRHSLWMLWENGINTDSGWDRNELAKNNDMQIVNVFSEAL